MKNPIKASDIQLMLSLFAPKHYHLFIFDPHQILEEDQSFKPSSESADDPMVLVNLAETIVRYKGYELEDFEMIFDFGTSASPAKFKQRKLSFIHNPDGSMRWLFSPGNLKSALAFYNASNWRSKLIAFGYHVLNRLKLERLAIQGCLTVKYQTRLKLEAGLSNVLFEDYSIFTGTKGYDRTPVVALETNGCVTHFAKVALNQQGLRLLKNESDHLRMYNYMNLKGLSVPQVVQSIDPYVLIVSNETEKGMVRSTKIGPQHLLILQEMFNRSRLSFSLQDTVFWEKILNNLSLLKQKSQHVKMEGLRQTLLKLKAEINPSEQIIVTLAHSDFTPWNIKVGPDALYVYDWELAQYKAPALFDIFHFHMQNGIFIKGHNLDQIMREITLTCHQPEIKTLIETHHINIWYYFKLYLLRTVSYYLASFQMRAEVTPAQVRQIKMWQAALTVNTQNDFGRSFRKRFIDEFYEALLKTPHAMLKFNANALEQLPDDSDLDIVILKEDLPNIIEFGKSYRLVQRVKLVKLSFMTTISLYFRDGSFLSIDLIHQLKRKNMQMMAIEPLLISATPNRYGVVVPAKRFDMEYAFLFYTLNHARIPKKYYSYFGSSNYDERNNGLDYLKRKYDLRVNSYWELFTKSVTHRKALKNIVLNQPFQTLSNRLKNTINYALDTLKMMVQNRGFIVTLSGVDGAGKSTIIKEVETEIKLQYRKDVVLLRHRPGLLPILSTMVHGSRAKAEHMAAVRKPRMGRNHNVISSLLRFAYYYTDYIIGQVYVYFKYVLRGKVVLYDRYYFDFIADAERSNIRLNKRFIKLLYLFIIKPKLNVLLWAKTQAIYQRKQELDLSTIHTLTHRYKGLFSRLSQQYKKSQYKVIENQKIDQTVTSIMAEFSKIV